MHVAGFDHEAAAVGHGVARIDGQVEDCVLELGGIGKRRPEIFRQGRLQDDMLAQRPLQDGSDALDGGIQIKDARLQRALAGEGEQPLNELCAALRRLVDLLHHRRHLRVVSDDSRNQLRHAHDDGQDVIEVVRDPSGQLP